MNRQSLVLLLLCAISIGCRRDDSTDAQNRVKGKPALGREKSNLKHQIGDAPPPLSFAILGPQGEATPSWADFKNQVVIIDFWATWCPPCIESIPHLNQLVAQFKNQPVTFLSITYEPEEMVEPFLNKYALKTTVGIDHDFQMFKSFGAWGIPMVFLIDRDGKIASTIHPKYLTAEVIRAVLAGDTPRVKQHDGWPDPEGAQRLTFVLC